MTTPEQRHNPEIQEKLATLHARLEALHKQFGIEPLTPEDMTEKFMQKAQILHSREWLRLKLHEFKSSSMTSYKTNPTDKKYHEADEILQVWEAYTLPTS